MMHIFGNHSDRTTLPDPFALCAVESQITPCREVDPGCHSARRFMLAAE